MPHTRAACATACCRACGRSQERSLTKRKRRTKRKSRPAQGLGSRRLTPELQRALDQVAQALEEGRAGEALERLAPLVAAHLRVAAVHDYLGYANLGLGNLWAALSAYERAMQLDRAEDRWLPLATLYFDLELRVHAVRALRPVSYTHLTLPTN